MVSLGMRKGKEGVLSVITDYHSLTIKGGNMNKLFMIGAGLVFMLAACTQQSKEVEILDKTKGAESKAGEEATGAGMMATEPVENAGERGIEPEDLGIGTVDKAGEIAPKPGEAATEAKDSLTGTDSDAAKKAEEESSPLK